MSVPEENGWENDGNGGRLLEYTLLKNFYNVPNINQIGKVETLSSSR